MNEQQIISLGVVAVAAGHLLWYAWRKAKRTQEGNFCSGCGSCGRPKEGDTRSDVRPAPQATPLISLSSAPSRRSGRMAPPPE